MQPLNGVLVFWSMKRYLLLFCLILVARLLPAQSPGDSLVALANRQIYAQQYDSACATLKECILKYPEKVRNNTASGVRQNCFEDSIFWEETPKKLYWTIYYQWVEDSLSSDHPNLERLYRDYPDFSEYNMLRYIYGWQLVHDGHEERGLAMLQDVLQEELAARYKSDAGFYVACYLMLHHLHRGEYQLAIGYGKLTFDKLPERRICSNDRGNMNGVYSNIGLAYAGLHQEDSALFYLGKIAFHEYPYSLSEPTLAIDSLIALLSRQDATPLVDRVDQAIVEIEFQDTLCSYPGARLHEIRSTIQLGMVPLPLIWIAYFPKDQAWTQNRFHKEWPFPYTKETCQAMVKASPFYRRLTGGTAAEVFER
jgi:hypothetical protein